MKLVTFQDIVSEAGYELVSYSGRGMYGNECASLHLDRDQSQYDVLARITDAAINLSEVHKEDGEFDISEWLELMGRTQVDSLGLGIVLYWKRMAWDESDEPTED